jgi:nicotinate dehydrogenase subunit B
MNISLTRRSFAQGLGASIGGIVLAFTLDPGAVPAQTKPLPGSLAGNKMLDAWLRINPDGSATVFTGKVELGQGIVTALAQIAAEELDLPLARVHMITADTGRTPNEGITSGSQSIEYSGTALRLAAAEVRALLLELAAPKLEMNAESLSVADGVISATNGKTITYGELAAAIDLHREARRAAQNRRPADPALRYSRQGHRQGHLCAGHPHARHGAWPCGAPAAIRRHAGLAR